MRSRGQVQSPAAQFPEGSPEGCTPPSGCHQDMHQQKKEGGDRGRRKGRRKGGDWVFPLLVPREGKVWSKLEIQADLSMRTRETSFLAVAFFGPFGSQLGTKPTLFSQEEPWGHLPQVGRRVCFSRYLEEPSTRQSLSPSKRRLPLPRAHCPHVP